MEVPNQAYATDALCCQQSNTQAYLEDLHDDGHIRFCQIDLVGCLDEISNGGDHIVTLDLRAEPGVKGDAELCLIRVSRLGTVNGAISFVTGSGVQKTGSISLVASCTMSFTLA